MCVTDYFMSLLCLSAGLLECRSGPPQQYGRDCKADIDEYLHIIMLLIDNMKYALCERAFACCGQLSNIVLLRILGQPCDHIRLAERKSASDKLRVCTQLERSLCRRQACNTVA